METDFFTIGLTLKVNDMPVNDLVKTVTSDGLELAGCFSDCQSDAAVFHTHGTAGDFYTHKFIDVESKALAENGISFLSANNRGHDVFCDIRKHNPEGTVTWLQGGGAVEKFGDCVFDIGAWLDFLGSCGVKKVILQGHSLSQKLVYYQSKKKDARVIGQVHLSPCNDAGLMYYSLGKEKYEETNAMIRGMVENGKGGEMLPKELSPVCPMTAQAYYGYLVEEGAGNIFPYHNPDSDKWEALASVREPVLAIFGGADPYIKPSVTKAAEMFRQKAESAKSVEVGIIEGAGHSFIGFESELVGTVMRWLAKTR